MTAVRRRSPPLGADLQHAVPALTGYQKSRAHLFPSPEALRWFIRNHQPELVAAGALMRIAGRLVAVPERFDQVVAQVGRRAVEGSR